MSTVNDVQGTVAAGFGPVAEVFAASSAELGDGGAAFAAVLDGEPVVDLWAGDAGAGPWAPHTRSVLMSSTKGVVTIAVARLVQRGELDVEAPVARYWPEFAVAGKAEVTVAQLLSHTAGLITVPGHEAFMAPDGTGWDRTDEIVRRLAGATPHWAPGTALGYHGITFGWLIGELVLRATGRTLGAIVRDELADPLGLELDLGTPPERQGLVASVLLPADDGANAPELEPLLASPAWSKMLLTVDGRSLLTEAEAFFTNPAILALELGGSNATGTARALAALYGALANGGSHDGMEVLSPETISLFTSERAAGHDQVLATPSRYGLGFARPAPQPDEPSSFTWGPHDEAFGHHGHGGQLAFADPVGHVGVGFVRSHLSLTSPLGPRLVAALYDCL